MQRELCEGSPQFEWTPKEDDDSLYYIINGLSITCRGFNRAYALARHRAQIPEKGPEGSIFKAHVRLGRVSPKFHGIKVKGLDQERHMPGI